MLILLHVVLVVGSAIMCIVVVESLHLTDDYSYILSYKVLSRSRSKIENRAVGEVHLARA